MIIKSQNTGLFRERNESKSFCYLTTAKALLSAASESDGGIFFNGVTGISVKLNKAAQSNLLNDGITHRSLSRRNIFMKANTHRFANAHLTITWGQDENSIIDGFNFKPQGLDGDMDIGCPLSREATMTYGYAETDYSDPQDEHLITYHLDVRDEIHYGWAIITSLAYSLTISSWSYNWNMTENTNSTPQLSETVAGIGALTLGAVCLRSWPKTSRTRQLGNFKTNRWAQ